MADFQISTSNPAVSAMTELALSGNPTSALSATASGTPQNWYIHTQFFHGMYVRNAEYNTTTSSTQQAPHVSFNQIDLNYTVQTNDEVMVSATYPGEKFIPQTLYVNSDSTTGGFGNSGVIQTSSVGYIRRAAVPGEDPSGACTFEGNKILDKLPGAYQPAYDTSTTIAARLYSLAGQLPLDCSSFLTSLVKV